MAALTNRYEEDDAYHLPPGMKRVGYDADTERYTFRQGDDLWLGEPGSLYGGRLKWAGKVTDADTSDSEGDDDDGDDDSCCSDSSKDGKFAKPLATGIQKARSLPYLQECKNEWGVPTVSISNTDARPPDTVMQRRRTFKKAAASTVSAIRVTRRWSKKVASSAGPQQEKSSVDPAEQEGEEDMTKYQESDSEKDQPRKN